MCHAGNHHSTYEETPHHTQNAFFLFAFLKELVFFLSNHNTQKVKLSSHSNFSYGTVNFRFISSNKIYMSTA